LEHLAAVATIRGDQAEALLFSAAAALVASRQITSDADLGPLLESPPADADPDVLRQLRHMYEAGGWVLFESALVDLPADLRWLFESGAVTIEQLARLHSTLGVTSAIDLMTELRSATIRGLPDLGPAVERAIAAALPGLRSAIPRIPLGRAVEIADPILERVRRIPGVAWAEPAGSLRRGQDMVGDVELVAPATDPRAVLDDLMALPDLSRLRHRSARRLYVVTDRVQLGIRCPAPEVGGATLLHMTGSAAHIDALIRLARERGCTLGPDGLKTDRFARPVSATEEDIYTALDLPFIAPEIRNGTDEIEAARNGTLPQLVARADIRGDLHMHTHWSDGRDSVDAMIQACASLGYEYIAITDHSQHSAAARNLSVDDVARQADEIAAAREKYPQIVVMHGCEVDIMADGKLDFPDRVLQRFDIVLASLHDSARHAPEQLLRRYLGAMKHPLVTMITHPTNRVVPHRPGYDIDYDRVIAAAVETGTVLEVDGSPSHLDMDGALARRAVMAGAAIAIDSDAHRAEMLERQMRLGLMTARRGWVEPRHVINARSVADVRALIAAKRSR
jgi:DNA polymerase (family 10)